MAKFFADSNVLLYTIGKDQAKKEIARRIVGATPTISVQVLNEFINVAVKKLKLPMAIAAETLMPLRFGCEVVQLTIDTHLRAIEIARANTVGIYDASIVAAAELAGCDVLYTEDLNHGQKLGRVSIVNPFKAA